MPSDDPDPRPISDNTNSRAAAREFPEFDEPFWLRRIHQIACDLLALEEEAPVARARTPKNIAENFHTSLRKEGLSSTKVMEDLAMVAAITPKTSSRRFFNQLFGGRDGMGTAAEILTALLNSSMYTHKIAGINANIEDVLIRELLELVGYSEGDGSFYPGGSISNLVSMILARDAATAKADPSEACDLRKFTAYTSECCHYSVLKNAGMAGIPRQNVKKVPVTADGRMDPRVLEEMILADKAAGARPFIINATSGTTVIGAFDPISEIADVAERQGLWLHIDAALGGGVMFSQEHRHLIAGAERSDSFAWCAHKMMGVPLSCSVLLVRHKGALEECLAAEADYLFQAQDQSMDFGQKSIQCGRRNDALKLWAIWRHRGTRGMGDRVDRLFEMARSTADKIEANPELELVMPPESTNVCFRTRDSEPAQVCRRLKEEQLALVGHAKVHGESIIRVPHANPDLDEGDVDFLLDAIVDADARCGR